MILLADSEGHDKTEQIRRLIWAYAVHICPKMFLHGVAHLTVTTSWVLCG